MKKIKEEIVTCKDLCSDEINFISYLKTTYPDGTIETSVPFDHRYEFEKTKFKILNPKDKEETSEQFKKRFNKTFFNVCNIMMKPKEKQK